MRKVRWILFFVVGLFFLGENPALAGEIKITIGVNDSLIGFKEQNPVIIDGNAYSPMEPLLNGIQAKTTYDPQNKIYTATINEKQITFSMVDRSISMNELEYLDSLKVLNGTPYIPVRLVSEYFGLKVKYLGKDQVVRVTNGTQKYTDADFIKKHRKELDKYFNIRPKNIVYLTFDDGPNAYTSQILDILKKKDTHATFFMIEGNIKHYPEVVKRMVKEENYPALHSVTHDKNKIYANPKNVASEMDKTRKTLQTISGFDSHLTRVPYGSKPYMKQPYRDDMVKNKFKMWDWTIDTEDWRYGKTPWKIVDKVKSGMQGLKGKNKPIVILLHDSKASASVLGEIIDYVRKQGYEPVSYDPGKHEVVNFWGDTRL